MDYPDGKPVMLGDRVRFEDGSSGQVVGIIDSLEFEPGFKADAWSYLETGVLISGGPFGLIHYPSVLDEDIELVARAER